MAVAFPHKIRRLAALARAGQPWGKEELPERVAAEYQGWLEAARRSSKPEQILIRLAQYCEEVERLRAQVTRSLIYPRLLLVGLGLLLLGLSLTLQVVRPGVAGWLALLCLLGLTLAFYRISANPQLAWGWLGSRRRARLEAVLWCANVAHLLELELDLPTACRWAALAVRGRDVRQQTSELEESLRRGGSLSQALQGTDWDPLLVWAAEAGECHNSLAPALDEAAQSLEENIRDEMNSTTAWLQPAALAIVGLLILAALVLFWLCYQNVCLEVGGDFPSL